MRCTSGNGGIESQAYKLAFLMLVFFPADPPLDGTANVLEKLSAANVEVVDDFLPDEETSCCEGLSLSSAGLVLEL